MTGKYTNPLKYYLAKSQRAVLRAYIGRMAHWEPMHNPLEGYSICIGGSAPLAAMLGANLELLARQDLSHCHKIYIVFDRPKEELPLPIEQLMREKHPLLPLQFDYYTRAEAKAFKRVGFPGCYSWFSWHKALARCQTRYAILHDFDALLIKPTILEDRFQSIQQLQSQWCGIRNYTGNGVIAGDQLVTTFEMILDAEFVRRTFRAIDAFNHVTTYRGRTVDFDTFLDCQTRAGTTLVLPIEEEEMVHPAQVVHQFTELTHRRHYIPPEHNNLLMIPYFFYLSGNPDLLHRATESIETMPDHRIEFFGRILDLSRLSMLHANWLRKQAYLLERTIARSVRSEVRDYFDSVESAARQQARHSPLPEAQVAQ